jgi:hypothetical protein
MKKIVLLSLAISFQACGMEVAHNPAIISVSVENKTPKKYLLFARCPTNRRLTKTILVEPNSTFHDDRFILPYSERDGYVLNAKIQSSRFLFFTKTIAKLRFYLNKDHDNHNQNTSTAGSSIRASLTSKMGRNKVINTAQEPMNKFLITLLPNPYNEHKLKILSALQA